MDNFEAIIDFGSQNLRLVIFDANNEMVYSSKQQITIILKIFRYFN